MRAVARRRSPPSWARCASPGPGITVPPASTGSPRDRQLGLRASGALSPGLAEMSALAGAEVSFTRAAALMAGLVGVTLSPRTIERSAEAAGAGRVDERQLTGLRAAADRHCCPSGRRQPLVMDRPGSSRVSAGPPTVTFPE
jgi:hypothetical protein